MISQSHAVAHRIGRTPLAVARMLRECFHLLVAASLANAKLPSALGFCVCFFCQVMREVCANGCIDPDGAGSGSPVHKPELEKVTTLLSVIAAFISGSRIQLPLQNFISSDSRVWYLEARKTLCCSFLPFILLICKTKILVYHLYVTTLVILKGKLKQNDEQNK